MMRSAALAMVFALGMTGAWGQTKSAPCKITPVSAKSRKSAKKPPKPVLEPEAISIGDEDVRPGEMANMQAKKQELLQRAKVLAEKGATQSNSPAYAKEYVRLVTEIGQASESPYWNQSEKVQFPKIPEPTGKALEICRQEMAAEQARVRQEQLARQQASPPETQPAPAAGRRQMQPAPELGAGMPAAPPPNDSSAGQNATEGAPQQPSAAPQSGPAPATVAPIVTPSIGSPLSQTPAPEQSSQTPAPEQ